MVIRSAPINVTCARITVNVISTASLFFICLMALENNIHKLIPKAIPPATMTKKVKSPITIVWLVNTPERSISMRMKNTATAVPSLKRLSHSNNKLNLLDIHKSLNIANTATGSVDAIIIPNKNITDTGIANPIHPSIQPERYAITVAAISSPNIAIVQIVI